MKNRKFNLLKDASLLVLIILINFSCEREVSEDATVATFPTTAEIFTDSPIAMGSDFYFPYGPDALNPPGSKFDAWSVDENVSYLGNASMRFDVPNANDPEGNFAGAIFRVEGAGRDLSGYDALTFWAKASQGVVVSEFGFGEDFFPNKYITTVKNVSIGTTWKKYIIPIPDASKLVQERGMFRYSAGSQATNGLGYTFWVDELRFEKLGTIAQPRPSIAKGVNKTISGLIGLPITISDLKETFNMPSGLDLDVFITPNYFVFKSSNPSVATVDASGVITILATGTAVITANLGGTLNTATNEFVGGIDAIDSITVNVTSPIVFAVAPAPTRDPSKVLSVFSNTYTNVPVTYYNGFWAPGSTTGSADFSVNGNNILNYTTFNYVGIAMSNPPLDASAMTMVHFDMFVPGSIPSNFDFLISIEDWGPNQVDNGSPQDDTRQQIFVPRSQVQANTWISIDAPLTLANRNNIGLIIMENINGSSLSNFYMDNIYFYRP